MVGVSVPAWTLVAGLVNGLGYGLLALGLVLIYRSNRVLNFAHGQLGVTSAVLVSKLTVDFGINYWPALIFVLLVAAVIGAGCELLLRRLFNRPRLLVMVATIAFCFAWEIVLARPEWPGIAVGLFTPKIPNLNALVIACGAAGVVWAQNTWVDEIANSLTFYKANYPTSNWDPYQQKLTTIREALGRSDQRTVKVEMGKWFKMLRNRAYGIHDVAADELFNFALMVTPIDEYGISVPPLPTAVP